MRSVRVLVILSLVLLLTVLLCDHQAQALGGGGGHGGGGHGGGGHGGFHGGFHAARGRRLGRFGRRHYGFGYRKQARRGYTWGPPGPRNAGRRRRPAGSVIILGGFSNDFYLWPYG